MRAELSDKTFVLWMGISAAVLHHFTLQHPVQLPFVTTLKCYTAAVPFFFLLSYLQPKTTLLNHLSIGMKTYLLYVRPRSSRLIVVHPDGLLKTVYNIFFRHRGIPGEIYCKASDWGLWKIYRSGNPHRWIESQHIKYGLSSGDVVRIQPNHISFSTLEAVEEIHGPRTKCHKPDFYKIVFTPPESPQNIFTITYLFPISCPHRCALIDIRDKRGHGFLRRVQNAAFSPASMKELDTIIHRYMNSFIVCIKKAAERNDGVVDMAHWFGNQMFAVVGELAIGSDFGALDIEKQMSGRRHFFPESALKFFPFVRFFWPIPWLTPGFRLLPTPKWLAEIRQKTFHFIADSISKRLDAEDVVGEKTLLGLMSKAVDPVTGETMSRHELTGNAVNLLFAGVDTTSTGITFTLYHLLARRSTWDQLSKEIHSQFASAEEITSNAVSSLPYLDAVVHEGLRLINPVPSFLPRVTPPEGMTISGTYIPGNTIVSTSFWRIMHDPKNFSNPYEFHPERWIKGNESTETCNKSAWLPFSTGTRSCLGRPLALLEMKLALAMFAFHFDAKLKFDGQPPPTFVDAVVVLRGPLEIKVTPVSRG